MYTNWQQRIITLEDKVLGKFPSCTLRNEHYVTTLEADIAANSEINLPDGVTFDVTSNNLLVNYNGSLCVYGVDYDIKNNNTIVVKEQLLKGAVIDLIVMLSDCMDASTQLNELEAEIDKVNSNAVRIESDQTIDGKKTFTTSPSVPTPTARSNSDAVNVEYVNNQMSNAVHKTGDETVAGKKTFSTSPVVPTPAKTDNSTNAASTAFVKTAIADLVGGAPESLDTLKEIADALSNDANLASTLNNKIAALESDKVSKTGDTIDGKLIINRNVTNGVNATDEQAVLVESNLVRPFVFRNPEMDPENPSNKFTGFVGENKLGKAIGALQMCTTSDGANMSKLFARTNLANNSVVDKTIAINANADGTHLVTAPETNTNAASNEIVTAGWANNKYFLKSGGEVRSDLAVPISIVVANSVTNSTEFYRDINCKDKNNIRLGHLRFHNVSNTHNRCTIECMNKSGIITSSIGCEVNGSTAKTYATHHPVNQTNNTYNNIVVTGKALMDYAPNAVRDITVYVDKSNITGNASDTNDLFKGRGLSESKPFLNFDNALVWAQRYSHQSGKIILVLLSDATYPTGTLYINCDRILIKGKTKNIVLKAKLTCERGWISFQQITIASQDSATTMFNCYYSSFVRILSDVTLSGTVSNCVFLVNNKATALLEASLSGNITGKRYSINDRGTILSFSRGANAIPGSTAGTVSGQGKYL